MFYKNFTKKCVCDFLPSFLFVCISISRVYMCICRCQHMGVCNHIYVRLTFVLAWEVVDWNKALAFHLCGFYLIISCKDRWICAVWQNLSVYFFLRSELRGISREICAFVALTYTWLWKMKKYPKKRPVKISRT